MNEYQANGMWLQIKGETQKVWGELTHNDFQQAKGSVEKLYGVIQEKFGDTREVILQKLEKLRDQ